MDDFYPVIREFVVVCLTAFIDGLNIAMDFWTGMYSFAQPVKHSNCTDGTCDTQPLEPAAVEEL